MGSHLGCMEQDYKQRFESLFPDLRVYNSCNIRRNIHVINKLIKISSLNKFVGESAIIQYGCCGTQFIKLAKFENTQGSNIG